MKKISKLKEYLFYILLALLPFNMRHIFNYGQIQSIEGFREHISWSLSAFDIVLLCLILLHAFELLSNMLLNNKSVSVSAKRKMSRLIPTFLKKPFMLFLIILAVNIAFATHPPISLYNSARIFEACLLFLIAKNLMLSDRKIKKRAIAAIFLGGMLQSLVALGQFATQKSLGLKLLGESLIAPDILGVSKFEFAGEKFIRAYGTFPHPNILGAFLLLALAAGAWLFLKKNSGQKLLGNVALVAGSSLIIVGIFLSYSRSVLLALAIFFTVILFMHKDFVLGLYKKYCKKLRIHFIFQNAVGLVIMFSILFLFYNLLAPRLCIVNCPGDKSVVLRFIYNKAAYATINDHPLSGVGAGCFVPNLDEGSSFGLQPWERQPAHNLYLLIASELGIVGFAAFLLGLAQQINAKHMLKNKLLSDPFVIMLFLFLALGLVDHYFWTIPQGQATFWLSLAFFGSSGRING